MQDSNAVNGDPPAHPRCSVCGDRIGVYEPAVFLVGGAAHRTSRAAEPELTAAPEAVFHDDCYPPA
jgi:hypothetical protein